LFAIDNNDEKSGKIGERARERISEKKVKELLKQRSVPFTIKIRAEKKKQSI
jgi:hypothetical protein